MVSATAGVVIIGAGHAGGSAAAFLRQDGYTGHIIIVGDEPVAPYQRPPLSKAWLKGETDADALLLRPMSFYQENDIELRLGTSVERIDPVARSVRLSGGDALTYDTLILATGARARPIALPGIDLKGVLALRTMADAEQLKGALAPGCRLVVIGGGYIGLEAAASAQMLGAAAVILEREPRVLARVACDLLSNFFQRYHQDRGVEFIVNADVTKITGAEGQVKGVALRDGREIPADVVLVGVGAVPNQELAERCGIACQDGVIVDDEARTSYPQIFAIGDCTRRPMPMYGDRMHRLESVPNALEQARYAAAAIVGKARPPMEVPWFWSDQYDLKLQIAGLPFDATETVVRGDVNEGKFAIFHLDAEHHLLAVEAVNAPPEFMGGRIMIGKKRIVSPDRLRDLSVSMKEVAA